MLGVENTIEAQTFPIPTGIVANVLTDTPFYLYGYEAVEKEIELIEGRENTRAFTEGLRDLEQAQYFRTRGNGYGLKQDVFRCIN